VRPHPGPHGTRSRARTLTTPVATPAEELSGFTWTTAAAPSSTTNYFNALPREVRLLILSFLQPKERIRCALINREWQDMVQDGALWKVLDTESFYAQIPAAQLRKLIERAAPFVQHLNLRGCTQLKDNIAFTLGNLQTVNFEGCRAVTSKSLIELLSRNGRLKALDINGLQAVDDHVLSSIVKHCPGLQALNISYCKKISSAQLSKTLEKLHMLRDLRIAECRVNSAMLYAIQQLSRLQRLCLSGCNNLKDSDMRIMIYGDALFGVQFPERTVRMAYLTHLDISRTQLTDGCVQYLCGTLPKLEKLEVAGVTQLTDSGLAQLLPHIPKLTHVDFEDCAIGDAALEALAASCRKVRHVQLSHCRNITDIGVLHLVDNLTTLQHLDLDNTQITNKVLSAVALQPMSMRLSLYDCPNISWTGVLSILTSNSTRPKYLKKLKTFYGWQRPVDGHTRACLKGDLQSAREIEKAWTRYMMSSSEEIMRGESGRSRFLGLDVNEQGARIVGREVRRPRACVIM
jgi:F-box/leucine-rich repeat protein 2/20